MCVEYVLVVYVDESIVLKGNIIRYSAQKIITFYDNVAAEGGDGQNVSFHKLIYKIIFKGSLIGRRDLVYSINRFTRQYL